ncbi:MAG TPA: amidohydrolase family protein [Candidatus Angelobacter sp.]
MIHHLRIILLTLMFCSPFAVAQLRSNTETTIRHVTVVNVVTGNELKDQTVRIQKGHIVSVTPTQEGDAALPGAVDAHGGYLIPGLWDMHVHVHDTSELALYIANGVTGIRIMAGEKNTATLRAELTQEKTSPEIYLASAIVDGSPPTWPGSIIVNKPAEARRTVDEIKAGGADFIKVYNSIPRDAYFALADEAKQQHISFVGHVPDAVTVQEASAAGQRSIEHLQGIALGCSSRQDSLMNDLARANYFFKRLEINGEGYGSIDQKKCHALFAEFRTNQTWQVPTLTVLGMWAHLEDSKFTSDPRLAYITHRSRERWEERTQLQRRRWTEPQYKLARTVFSVDKQIVNTMSKAAVPMMAGTDAMNPFCFPGFSLHDELALLVESGLTPLAALQMATINPARFLGRIAEMGTIEPGKNANLVLLRADPLADIHNTTQIQAVWLHGEYFDRDRLDQLLENVKKSAKH